MEIAQTQFWLLVAFIVSTVIFVSHLLFLIGRLERKVQRLENFVFFGEMEGMRRK